MLKKYDQLVPSVYELWYVILTSTALLIAGCMKIFLQRYDLIGSSSVVQAQFGDAVGNGLGALDSFSITANAITFIVWGAIGLGIFSLVQAFVRASSIIKFERDLSSNRYVHPANFNRRAYWRTIIRNTLLSFLLLGLLVISGIFYLVFIIPVSFYYTQSFLIQPSLFNVLLLAYGLFTIFFGTFLVYLVLKAVIWQHRVSIH